MDPYDLVKKSDVEVVLRVDKGADATLKSFQVEDFTAKGDNYACKVTSVVVQYEKGAKQSKVSYVVKLNPGNEGFAGKMVSDIFEIENIFYSKILPLLDQELVNANEPKLRAPKYFHCVSTRGKEVLYLEDLRVTGYKMHNRKDTLDKHHADLIVRELARFHASSVLLFSKPEYSIENFGKKFPQISKSYETMKKNMDESGIKMLENGLDSAAQLTDQIPEYEYVSKYLRSKIPTIDDEFSEMVKPKAPFITLRHGDCWNNNFLFR